MKLLMHLVRWDVRRVRVLLFVWIVLVAANVALEGLWPTLAVDPATRELTGIIDNLLSLAELLLTFVVVAIVVHAHTLVGTTAFWTTRPIPPVTLLSAKLALLVGTMIIVPVIANVVLMVAYNVPANSITGVAAQTALVWALWIAVITAAASITPNLAKFALLVGGAAVAIAAALSVAIAVTMYRFGTLPLESGQERMNEPTSGVVSMALTIAAAIALLVAQYRTRNRVLSCAAGALGVAVAYLAADLWRWPVLAPISSMPAWAADPSTLNLTASADTIRLEQSRSFQEQTLDWKTARARVRLARIEPGWSADVGLREATVRAGDDPALISRLPGHQTSVPFENLEERPQVHEVTRRVLDVASLIDGSGPPQIPESTVVLFARAADIKRLTPAEGAYEGRFDVGLIRHDIETVLPLTRGATHQNGAYRVSVTDVQRAPGSVSILVRQSDARSVFDRRLPSSIAFYLRNRRASQAIAANFYDLRSQITLMRTMPFSVGFGMPGDSGFYVRAELVRFPPEYGPQMPAVKLDDSWVKESELVVVRSTREGFVERRLTIPHFPVGGR